MRLTLAGPTLKRCSNLFQTNLWQGSRLIAETDNDKHWQSYLYEPDSYRPLALVHGNAQQDNIKLYWYQNDHLGTPIALTGSLGDTLYECQYNAYGQIINETYHQDDTQALPDNPLRFQGQYYDEETGLHYNLNRYYDPFTGRYITQDPLGILGGLNSYQYVNGDPINWIDPLGLIKVENSGFEGINATDNIGSSLKLGETQVINGVSVTRVGWWMSPKELEQMQNTGKVVQGGGGQTFISINGANDFKSVAANGSVYVEFDVPTNSLIQGGKEGWYKLLGSDAKPSQKYLLNKQGGTLTPNVSNIRIVDKKLEV
jgi:RHS repeat-associated protein